MVSKVFVSSSSQQQLASRRRPRPKTGAAREDIESLSTLGMNDVSTPTERALREMRSPPPKGENPPRLIVTPRTSNHTTARSATSTRDAEIVKKETYPSRRPGVSRPLSRQDPVIPTFAKNTSLRKQQFTRHSSASDRHHHYQRTKDQNISRQSKTKHQKRKKEVTRDPQLQAALDAALERLKERRHCEGSVAPSSHMRSAIDHIIHLDEMQHHPSLHIPALGHDDEIQNEAQSFEISHRDRRHQTRQPQERFPLDREFTDMRELRDVVEIFSEYESILNHLVQKHSKLMAYVEGSDNLPEEFHSTSHEVKKRLAKLRLERREKLSLAGKRQISKTKIVDSKRKIIPQGSHKDARHAATRRSPKRHRDVPRSTPKLTPVAAQSLKKSVSNQETRRRIVTDQETPKRVQTVRYGRNEGFIHGCDQGTKTLASGTGHQSTNHHKNSHLLYRANQQEGEDSSSPTLEQRTTTQLRARSSDGYPSYERSDRIQKLREELEHLRKQRKASPHRQKQSTVASKVDPVPSSRLSCFPRPTSPSALDPGGERYNIFTKAVTVQPEGVRAASRVDAPGTRIHELLTKQGNLDQNIPSRPQINQPLASPKCQSLTAQHDKSANGSSNEVPNGYSSESSYKKRSSTQHRAPTELRRKSAAGKRTTSPLLPAHRKRIEEIERMVVESKSNELDKELEQEILKMGPLFTEESLSYSEDFSSSTNGDDDSSDVEYDTESSAENGFEPVGDLARPYHHTMGKAPSNDSSKSSRVSEKDRRAEFLRRIIHNRDTASRTPPMDRSGRLSKLMPEPVPNETRMIPPVSDVPNVEFAVLPKASSLSSTDDESDSNGHFLPVTPSNRGRWQSFARVAPEESIDLAPSFAHKAKQFLSQVGVFSSFSHELQGDQNGVSFDTMNKRARQSHNDDHIDDEDDYSTDFNQEIQMVQSEDGVIHVHAENEDYMNESDQGFEASWKYEEELENDDSSHSNLRLDGRVEHDNQRLRVRREHYLQLSPSYKEQNDAITTNGQVSLDDRSVSTSTNDHGLLDNQSSTTSEAAECRYTPAPPENEPWDPPKDVFATSQDEDPSRTALRQVSKSLLSCNSSTTSTDNNTSRSTGTALDLLKDDSEDGVDRYMPQTGLGNRYAKGVPTKPDPDSGVVTPPQIEKKPSTRTTAIQPPSHEEELDEVRQEDSTQRLELSKQDPPTKLGLFEHERPQQKPIAATVVASPKGTAIPYSTNEKSWLNPFGFWG